MGWAMVLFRQTFLFTCHPVGRLASYRPQELAPDTLMTLLVKDQSLLVSSEVASQLHRELGTNEIEPDDSHRETARRVILSGFKMFQSRGWATCRGPQSWQLGSGFESSP